MNTISPPDGAIHCAALLSRRCIYGCHMAPADAGRHVWVDATAGVAGDMLLAAFVDAGAPLAALQAAVNAVTPESIELTATEVRRAALRATKVDVKPVAEDQARRSWREIQALLDRADLAVQVRERAQRVLLRLAEAEARVHGSDSLVGQ